MGDHTADDRQKKFRDQLKESGKKQRTFYLSDSALDTVKKHKDETNAPSLNHALESLLTSTTSDQTTDRQKKILEAAQRLGELKRKIHKTPPEHPDRQPLLAQHKDVTDEIMMLTTEQPS